MMVVCECCQEEGSEIKMARFIDDGWKYIHDACTSKMLGEDVVRQHLANKNKHLSCPVCSLEAKPAESMVCIFSKGNVGGLYIHDACIAKKLKESSQ